MFPGCPCKCHKEEAKEDTKKEHEESYIEGCGCDKCWKDAVRRLKEFVRDEPPKEPVKNPTFLVYDIYGEGATATKVLNMRRSLEVIAKYLDETQ